MKMFDAFAPAFKDFATTLVRFTKSTLAAATPSHKSHYIRSLDLSLDIFEMGTLFAFSFNFKILANTQRIFTCLKSTIVTPEKKRSVYICTIRPIIRIVENM